MSVVAIEGIVDRGQIRLPEDVHLPDGTVVYVIVPGTRVTREARMSSPRLARPLAQAADLEMQITEDVSDGCV